MLAAIAGFEVLAYPAPRDLQQFSNLFLGLFPHVADDTRRIAAAALSRLQNLPETVADCVIDQPIEIAAPFLACNSGLNDRMLLQAVARHGIAHARAIARRKSLSKVVVTALVELDDSSVNRSLTVRGTVESDGSTIAQDRSRNEEQLRQRLKTMALERRKARSGSDADQRAVLGHLLAQQAPSSRRRFAECLALALRSDSGLAKRIMLDPSGRQLAMALQTLGLGEVHALACLEGVFPHLARENEGVRLSRLLLRSCDPFESRQKVEAWRRANAVHQKPVHQPHMVDLPGRSTRIPQLQQRPSEARERIVKSPPSRRA